MVLRLVCPSNSWSSRTLAPRSKRSVAYLCRREWAWTSASPALLANWRILLLMAGAFSPQTSSRGCFP